MAGVTDKAFRLITKPFGPALYANGIGERVSIIRAKTADLLAADGREMPLAVQIFGHEPKIMADIARTLCPAVLLL